MDEERINILLVEDEKAHVRLIQRAFESRAGQVSLTVVGTLREVRAHLAHSAPDLVIADLVLPDGKATELLPADKEKSRLPVVLMTCRGNEQVAVEALKAGAMDYVVKSEATMSDMSRIAERALRQWKHITDRRRAEEALQKAHDDLEQRVQQRTAELAGANAALRKEIAERKRAEEARKKEQRLLRQLLDSQERDQKLVAYEIHDGLAQQLTGAVMQFQTFSQLQDPERDATWTTFHEGLRLLDDSLAETRRLIDGLRPPILDDLGIVAAIDCLIGKHQERGGPQTEFVHDVRFDRLAPVLETALFRIVQETLTNARCHSRSEKVRVELAEQEGRVRVEIQDWGIGFDEEQVEEGRFGLQGIRERARLLGGRATVETASGKGTRITVELPMLGK